MIKRKTITTIVKDIYNLFTEEEHTVNKDNATLLGHRIADTIKNRLTSGSWEPRLRLSNIGTPCKRKLWYSIKTPEDGEPLDAPTRIKFLFGDILEELVLFLARESGHKVEGEQDLIHIGEVRGKRDAVIDGITTDIKSASSYSFKKFDYGLKEEDDVFGYIDQLQSYLEGSQDDPLVTKKDEAAFLVIDKQFGKITLDKHRKNKVDYKSKVKELQGILEKDEPPRRDFGDIKHGQSGNMKLGTVCAYCAFKHKCWPGLRTFLYSNKPEHLTKVIVEPKVPELNK